MIPGYGGSDLAAIRILRSEYQDRRAAATGQNLDQQKLAGNSMRP